jgi:hypothetical protein
MAKFVGTLAVVTGYTDDTGIWRRVVKKIPVAGDLLNDNKVDIGSGDKVNDDLTFSNRFSILASPDILTTLSQNSEAITPIYIEYFGIKLKVTSISIKLPRIELSVGGVWLDEQD